jgi:tetratricopeptide (TPR) repeat protein
MNSATESSQSRLNTRFGAWLLVAVVALAAGIHLLHAVQVKRQAGAWLRRAHQARAAGLVLDCLTDLNRYLAYEPGDTDALVEYGLLLAGLNAPPRTQWQACAVLERALIRQPQHREARLRLAQLAMNLGRWPDAQAQLTTLLAATPDDAPTEHLLGICRERMGDAVGAAAWYENAIRHAPHQIDSFACLACLLRDRLDRPHEAAVVMERLVAANAQSFQAHLALARFAHQSSKADGVARALARARQLAPMDLDVLLATGALGGTDGNAEDMRAYLQRGLDNWPRDVRLYQALADLELKSGRPQAAIACWQRALKVSPRNPDLLNPLCDCLMNTGALAAAEEAIVELRRAGSLPAWVGYWDARLLMQKQQWGEAAGLLKIASGKAAGPDWQAATDLALAQCYERLGDRHAQLTACQRALANAASSVEAHLGVGDALLALGQADQAVEVYRRAVQLPRSPAKCWTALARGLLMQNRNLPAAKRDWKQVEGALKTATADSDEVVPALLARAEVLVAKDDVGAAQALLKKARDAHPFRAEVWCALAAVTERQGRWQAALEVLDQAGPRLGQSVEILQARARILAGHGAHRGERLARLEEEATRLPRQDQDRLLPELAQAYDRVGELSRAQALWQRLTRAQPSNLEFQIRLAETCVRMDDGATMAGCLEQLRGLEGEAGSQWRVSEAAWLIRRAEAGERGGLERAAILLGEATLRRPDWTRVPLLAARIDELHQDLERAIEHYGTAVALGERQPAVVERLAELLFADKRYAEAEQAIQLLAEQSTLSRRVARLATEVVLALGQRAEAVRRAWQAAPETSRDFRDHLWLARVLDRTDRSAEARAILRRVVERWPSTPDVWVALVTHLARLGNVDEAARVLQEALQRLDPAQAPLVRAVCLEALGQREEASAQFQAALRANPEDCAVLRQVSDFYLRTCLPGRAEPCLRELLDPIRGAPGTDVAWARRNLALLLASAGAAHFDEALALIRENLGAGGGSLEDQRARARVLASQPGHYREAIAALEESGRRRRLNPEEQAMLAKLHEGVGDRQHAREHLLAAVAATNPNPHYLVEFIRALIRWGDKTEAEKWLARLEQTDPRNAALAELRRDLPLPGRPKPPQLQ